MTAVYPLSVVLKPGSQDDVDDLVRVADVVLRDIDRVEIGSHRKGLELRCVWFDDADAVVERLGAKLNSEVRIVEHSVRMLVEPELMEPVMRVEMLVPQLFTPVVMALFDELRGRNVAQTERDGRIALVAEAPLNEILDLPSRLRALTDDEASVEQVIFSHHQRM